MIEYARPTNNRRRIIYVEDLNSLKTSGASEKPVTDLREIDVSKLPSPVLARLIEEVRNEEPSGIDAYSRFHNRHNRSR
jgi:hypothetical protein